MLAPLVSPGFASPDVVVEEVAGVGELAVDHLEFRGVEARPAVGVPVALAAGQVPRHAAAHALVVPWSFSNMYTVRPVVSTRRSPSFGSFVTLTVAFAAGCGALAGLVIVKGTLTLLEITSRPVSGISGAVSRSPGTQ